MTIDWGIFITPEFLIGVVIIGLLLNVAGAYVVRSLDWLAAVLPASFRRAKEAESARIQRLTDAATSDHALYAALAAEATRFHALETRHAVVALGCFFTLMLLLFLVEWEKAKPGTPTAVAYFVAVFLAVLGFVEYSSGLDSVRRARRLDAALRAVHRKLNLPVME